MSSKGLRVVCALAAEAAPIIRSWQLLPVGTPRPFRVYRDHEGLRWLVVSGVGKSAAAAAVAHLAAVSDVGRAHAWINIGICGHDRGPVGEIYRAHKVVDAGSGRRWYPPQIFQTSFRSDQLRTVDSPDGSYDDVGMVDMEASGFYASAIRYTTQELVQVLKVVSDCPDEPVRRFSAAEVSSRVESALGALHEVEVGLLELSSAEEERLADPDGLTEFVEEWHFSESHRVQLRKLLNSWQALYGTPVRPVDFAKAKTGRDVIQALSARINTRALRMEKP